jgi:hypothetical protein
MKMRFDYNTGIQQMKEYGWAFTSTPERVRLHDISEVLTAHVWRQWNPRYLTSSSPAVILSLIQHVIDT